jgi:hypothetical protein
MRQGSIALFLTVMALLLTGCGLVKSDPPAIGSLTLTDRIDEHTKAATSPRDGFPAQTGQFFASVQVLNPVKQTKVMARWYFDQKLIDEYELTFDVTGDRYVAFQLTSAADKPFPSGPYKVEVLLDGRLVEQKEFRVE